ncbi:MAG: phosphoribosylglycinamide formyltransferase [Candidatus Cloacimonetes bacterium]|nr:phosphoribosylglycinamide formyltransferase [Candidatus Cloacimonadota bacterium]
MSEIAQKTKNIAVLTSGKSRGSNFCAIHNWFQEHKIPVRISFVTVNNPHAPIIEKCNEFNINHIYLSTKDMVKFEHELLTLTSKHNIELIVLAGFLKKLSVSFIRDFGKPILNIHPALLPKYGGQGMYGLRVHQAVFAAREKESGVTVHLVNEDYDAGETVVQQKIYIGDCHTPEEIAARVLRLEHQIYAPTIWKILSKGR